MASLAGLLQLHGHCITGSDKAAYPPMSDLLHSLGIPVLEPYSEANLQPVPDLVVIGNALSRGNAEVEYVLDKRIPFVSMAALLKEEFLKGREPLVVAGTHGKTTTTSMLAWIYQCASRENAAIEPSFLIGGVAGIGIAEAGLRLLAAIGPANLPRLNEISLDARSIAFTLGLSLVSALLFGSHLTYGSDQRIRSERLLEYDRFRVFCQQYGLLHIAGHVDHANTRTLLQ